MLDFDGTVAAIVTDPGRARPVAGVLDLLAELAERYALVAVISGRPASFLAEHLAVPAVQRWGAYGLERVLPSGEVVVDAEAARWQPQIAEVVGRANSAFAGQVRVEDKGTSVTIHYRDTPEQTDRVRAFAVEQAEATGLAMHDAKMSVELRPPTAVDKGTVVTRLVTESGVRAACFIGDDVGDLTAFRALDAAQVAVRVAVRSDETPRELLDAADIVVDGTDGARSFLRELAAP